MHAIFTKLKIMMASVSPRDLKLVMASLKLCLLTVWSPGEHIHMIPHLSDFNNFSFIKVNELKQGEQKAPAAVKSCCVVPGFSAGGTERKVF